LKVSADFNADLPEIDYARKSPVIKID